MASEGSVRAAELEALIRKHQDLYYNGEPEISDAEFDDLWDELRLIDPTSPLLARVGPDSADGWPKARHLMPMGSQDKASNPEDFLAWAAKVGHPDFLVQYKLDGASIELQYEDGRLLRAVTRGDGDIGDDITPNAVRMRGVLLRLSERFTGGVRGEVVMEHAVHAARYPEKANCRNAANGLMKRKDGSGSEDLLVICYDASAIPPESGGLPASRERHSGAPWSDEPEKMSWLRRMGFETVDTEIFPDGQAVVDYRGRVMAAREQLPWDIDGLVVKGRSIDPADMSRPRPEKQIAFKFSLEEAVTTLRDVEWSESGANYTPIGIVEPVRLAGTTVQRANLCNTNIIASLGIKIGAQVVITKRGEIIPKIESLVGNPPDAAPITVPSVCSCGERLVDEGTRLYCPNAACPKKELHRLGKWLSVLDIRSFGSGIVEKLHASGRVRRIADLYGLTVEELSSYDRMGEVLATKILRNLRAKSEIRLTEFIAGFDIENIGELIAEKAVAAGFDSLDRLRAATVEELSGIDGFAEITARNVSEGLAALAGEMDSLLATGVVRIAGAVPGGGEAALAGKSFCFTGELASMKRGEAESLVKSMGGSAKGSVTKGLSYLVTNDPDSGSEKSRKAREYGVAIIDEEAFLALVGRS